MIHKSVLGLLGITAAVVIATPVAALDDARQVMVAGTSMAANSTLWAGPGMSNVFGNDFPGTGKGEQAASVRMPAGTLSNLRVNVTTENAPSAGTLRVRLRVNGADTTLTCQVTGTATCNKISSIAVAANSLVVLQVTNNFTGSGNIAWTASLEFD